MSIVSTAKRIGRLSSYLESKGFSVEEVTELADVEGIVAEAEKPYLTSMNSPLQNDFTRANSLWLVARKNGVPAFVGCAKLEDLLDEEVTQYWSRLFKRHYGRHGEITHSLPMVDRELRGRLVYFGDLFVSRQFRGSLPALRAFVAIGHSAVSLKWDPDWTYCFIRERDVMRGASSLYGFTRVFGNPFDWGEKPPPPRNGTEWLVAVPRSDVSTSCEATIRTVLQTSSSNYEKREV